MTGLARLVCLLGLVVALLPARPAAAAGDGEDVIMIVGESRSISAPGVSSVVVGNPAVMDAVAPPGSVDRCRRSPYDSVIPTSRPRALPLPRWPDRPRGAGR